VYCSWGGVGYYPARPHLFADKIKRHPEVEVLLVTIENRTDVMNKVLNWLKEEASPSIPLVIARPDFSGRSNPLSRLSFSSAGLTSMVPLEFLKRWIVG